MKRFWESVSVIAAEDSTGHCVALDDRPVRTPARHVLVTPTRALADAISEEWRAQVDTVEPATMPLMKFACTAIDRVAPRRDAVIDEVVAYSGSDLLCYRAEAPPALVARQHALWQPLLDWVAMRFDAGLRVTTGVVPVPQPDSALAAVRAAVAGYDDMRLTVLHTVTGISGSAILGLSLVEGRLDGAQVAEASQVDERFQAEQWGNDDEAVTRRTALEDEISNAARLLNLLNY